MTTYRHRTDENGRFKIVGLVPGLSYDVAAMYRGDPADAFSNDIAKRIVLKPGEIHDLGTVVLKAPTREQIEARVQSSPKPVALSP